MDPTKLSSYKRSLTIYFFFNIIILLINLSNVAASSGSIEHNQIRTIYDMVMNWINFTIIVIIFLKYGLPPLKKFIKNQKNDIEKEIIDLQSKKEAIDLELEKAINLSKKNEKKLIKLKKQIISEGETKCQYIIEQAIKQSNLIIETTKHKGKYLLEEANKKTKNEIIDMAIVLAERKLLNLLSSSYSESTITDYINNIKQKC